jgi:hypothetical protein
MDRSRSEIRTASGFQFLKKLLRFETGILSFDAFLAKPSGEFGN